MKNRIGNKTKDDLRSLESVTQSLAQLIGPAFDEAGALFALLGFTTGKGGWSTYVSNAERGSMIKALRDMADTLERNEDMPPIMDGEPEA